MIIFVGLLLLVALFRRKPLLNNTFYLDYASRDQSRAINGICIMLILFSHTFAKVSPHGVFDDIYESVRVFLGQFVVVPFLFYSGYGIMESLTKKEGYLKTFPRKRFFRIVLQFFVITGVYVIMHICLGSDYSFPHVLLSFVGITSIGNGGWYIFTTFYHYVMIILWFNIFKTKKIFALAGTAVSFVALMLVEIKLGFPTYFYNTIIFCVVGMVYSLVKKQFDNIVMKNSFTWAITFAISVLGFVLLKKGMNISSLVYPIWCGFGMLAILCFTMKVKVQNKILVWLGTTTFFSFTLQGIPQIIFSKFLSNNYIYYFAVILFALSLTALGYYVFEKLPTHSNMLRKKSNEKCDHS